MIVCNAARGTHRDAERSQRYFASLALCVKEICREYIIFSRHFVRIHKKFPGHFSIKIRLVTSLMKRARGEILWIAFQR